MKREEQREREKEKGRGDREEGRGGGEKEGKRDICSVHVSVRTWCAPRAQHQGADRGSQVCSESRCSAWGRPLGPEPSGGDAGLPGEQVTARGQEGVHLRNTPEI